MAVLSVGTLVPDMVAMSRAARAAAPPTLSMRVTNCLAAGSVSNTSRVGLDPGVGLNWTSQTTCPLFRRRGFGVMATVFSLLQRSG